ncbi:MAG: 3-deoxy-D-manno-octulosonic acid transferase [Acidobacteria bacterium]|nr:3-deoxy-D-manno-octulosonic acid transferase [Acidobacteriota bacterium]
MFFLYSFLYTIGFLVLLPRFLFDALRKGKYAAGFWERFGYLPEFERNEKPVLWLHCVSVGETQAARPIVKELLREFPDFQFVVSTTTNTGQTLARKLFAEEAKLVFYFPFDWRFTVRRALRRIKPSIVLIMETELWFNFLREAHKSGAKIAIVNGRLSEKSAKHYSYIKKLISSVLHYIDLALMQEHKDAKRLTQLGIRADKVKITGNVKFDQDFDENESDLTKELRERFDVSKDAPLIIAASTHAPEESIILRAFKETWENSSQKLPRLLIAPRHPERFKEVAELVEESGFQSARRSEKESEKDKLARVILLDSVGELRAVFPLAEIVFVGGSLISHGGQNVLEPAMAQKAIVTGFYTMNFEAIVKEFLKQNAIVQLPESSEKEAAKKLAEVFLQLLQDADLREKLAKKAFAFAQDNRGASRKTVEHLKSFLLTREKL